MPRKVKPVEPVVVHDSPLLPHIQAAAYLQITSHTLDVWRSANRYQIPHYRIGGRVFYKKSDLDAWLESRKVGA